MRKLSAVITSTGIATAIGLSEEETWRALRSGKSGIRRLKGYEYRGAGLPAGVCNIEAVGDALADRGVSPGENEQRVVQLAFYVVHEALRKVAPLKPGERRGFYLGSSLTVNDRLSEGYEQGFLGKRSPPGSLMEGSNCYIASRVSQEFGQEFGLNGPCVTLSSSCASGLQCVGLAMRDLELGILDEAVVVGVDSALVKYLLDTWMTVRVLSRLDPPETAARPFCATRRGFVYGEGAGCVVMRKEAPDPLLEILGVNSNCGAENLFAVTEKDMIRCMQGALEQAGLSPPEIDFVHASANGSRQGDLEEARALNKLFGRTTPVYSSKALYGNTQGASGLNNLIHSMLALRNQHLPRNPHIFEKDPEIESLINCSYEPRNSIRTGLLNTFGFGGMNASIVFRKI